MKDFNLVSKPDHVDPIRPEECVYDPKIPDYVIETVNAILKDKFARRNYGEVSIYEGELKTAILEHPAVAEIMRQLRVDNPGKTQSDLEIEFIRELRDYGGFDFADKYKTYGWSVQHFEDRYETGDIGWIFSKPGFLD